MLNLVLALNLAIILLNALLQYCVNRNHNCEQFSYFGQQNLWYTIK